MESTVFDTTAWDGTDVWLDFVTYAMLVSSVTCTTDF